jgi:transcriptional regulator with XRE-family HTH domain
MATTEEKPRGKGRPRSRPLTPAGERIVRFAKSRGFSLQQLAEKASVSEVSLYAIIGGTTPDPRVSTLRAVADALGVTLDRLWPRQRSSR